MNNLPNKNILKNNAKSSNKVFLRMYKGVLTSNIIDTINKENICIESLDFSCADNSQYLPLV